MNDILKYLSIVFLVYVIFAVTKVFEVKENLVRFSKRFRLVPIYFIVLVAIIECYSLFVKRFTTGDVYLIPLIVAVLVFTYFVWMLRLELTPEGIVWCNGIWISRFSISSLSQINFYSGRKKIIRIGFVLADKENIIRNDLNIESKIEGWAKLHQIKTEQKRSKSFN